MKEFSVTLTQNLKEQQLLLNQHSSDGWQVENIKHILQYDWNIVQESGNIDDLYPTDVKTVTTFSREINNK